MDNLIVMNGLTDARAKVRESQFKLANSAPVVWDMLQRVLKYLDKQQAETLTNIRNA